MSEITIDAERKLIHRGECCIVWGMCRVSAGESNCQVYADLDIAESTFRGWFDKKKKKYQDYEETANEIVSRRDFQYKDRLESASEKEKFEMLSEVFLDNYGPADVKKDHNMKTMPRETILDLALLKIYIKTRLACGETLDAICKDSDVDRDTWEKWTKDDPEELYKTQINAVQKLYSLRRKQCFCPKHHPVNSLYEAFEDFARILQNRIDVYTANVDLAYQKLWLILEVILLDSAEKICKLLRSNITRIEEWFDEHKDYASHESHALAVWNIFIILNKEPNVIERQELLREIFDYYVREGMASDLVESYNKRKAEEIAKLKKQQEERKKKKLRKASIRTDDSSDDEQAVCSKVSNNAALPAATE